MDLPDEWVEAAARALMIATEADTEVGRTVAAAWWDATDAAPQDRDAYRQRARAALAAVAPLIAAQAWDEGASWGERMAGATAGEDNPYRKEES